MADWDRAVLDAYTDLLKKLRAEPTLLLVSCAATFPAASVAAMLSSLCPSAVIHGTSSCKGCITSDGHHTFGLLGIVDHDGRYAVGLSKGATSAATAGPAYHRVLGGSIAARATGAATGVGCLLGGVGGGRLGPVWVSLHGERQNISRLETTLCSFLWYWNACLQVIRAISS